MRHRKDRKPASESTRRARNVRRRAVSNTKRRRTKHARPKRPPRLKSEPRLEHALRDLRSGKSQKQAARDAGVPVKRFRQFLRGNKLAHFRKGKWRFTDRRIRTVQAITTRGKKRFKVRGFNPSSTVMSHRDAVKSFLADPDVAKLEPFEGVSVTDTEGRTHKLETRPNVLYRLSAAGTESYEEIYRLTT